MRDLLVRRIGSVVRRVVKKCKDIISYTGW